MGSSPLERRRFPRYRTDLPITVTVGECDLKGYYNQIAEGGLGALLPEEVQVGSVVWLQFIVLIEPIKLLRVQAAVRYQIGPQHGLEFLSLNEGERLAIRQFCGKLPPVSRA